MPVYYGPSLSVFFYCFYLVFTQYILLFELKAYLVYCRDDMHSERVQMQQVILSSITPSSG